MSRAMESFEELGLGPELVEALAAEGLEEPTPFQSAAIPVIRRGNNLLGRAGPGAGTLVAWGAALLDRLEAGAGTPRALVLTPSAESARQLAESLASLAAASGHTLASVGAPWVLPERADLLFGTPSDLLEWARASRFDVNAVEALVVDQASALQRVGGLGEVEALLEFIPKEAQRVVLALPVTPEIENFVERHVRRAVQVPPAVVEAEASTKRGEVRYRIVEEPREAGVLQLVAELLEDTRHCCLFFATEDRAADVGDYLTMHGYAAGAPGDEAAPVWLAVLELAARPSLDMPQVVAVSYDAPAGPDGLDRRHGGGHGGVIVVLPREMPHLRDVARRTGYRVVPFPPAPVAAGRSELDALIARLDAAAGDADLGPYLVALEPLFARKGAAEVAAAAVALLRQRPAAQAAPSAHTAPAAPSSTAAASRTGQAPPPAFVRLYISLGERDDAGPGDIVGAITGEAGVAGAQVGKIEVRDTFSIVEVQDSVAERVIKALNGITIRGRSVRADYDRARAGGREGRAREAPRSGESRARPAPRGKERGPRDNERGPEDRGAKERGAKDRAPRDRSEKDRAPRDRAPRDRAPEGGSDRGPRGPKPGGPRGPKPGGPRSGPKPGGPRGVGSKPGGPRPGGPRPGGPKPGGPKPGGPKPGGPRGGGKGGPSKSGGGSRGPRPGGRPPGRGRS